MHGYAALIQAEKDRFGLDSLDPQARDVGERSVGRRVTEILDAVHRTCDGAEPSSERARRARFRAHIDRAARRTEACATGDVFITAAPGPLLRAAHHEGRNA